MTEEQQAALVSSQVACALIEMEAMKAENRMREISGAFPTYGEKAFLDLIEKYSIGYNSTVGFFQQ